MKILIIRFSPISDIILTSLLIRCLKKQLPDTAELHFLTDEHSRFAVEFNPHISKLHVLAHSRELMIEEAKLEEYDHVIDLENSEMTTGLKHQLKAKWHTFKRYSFRAKLYRSLKVNFFSSSHLAEYYLQAADFLELKNDQGGLDYFISTREETKKEDIPTSHHAGFIVCDITSDVPQQWQDQKWMSFCSALDHPIILMGGKKDAGRGKEIASADPVKIYNACGKFSFNEAADLVKKSKLILTPASGLMYVAAAYKRPVVWLDDDRFPSSFTKPYYGDKYLSDRPKSPFAQCRVKDDEKEIMRNVVAFL